MNTLRVSSRSDSKNVTSAFKEPVENADEEPDSRRRSCAHINQRYRAIFRVIHPDKLKSEDAEQLSVALQDAKKAAVEELQRREKTVKRDAATADAGAASKSTGEAEKRNAAEPAATEETFQEKAERDGEKKGRP